MAAAGFIAVFLLTLLFVPAFVRRAQVWGLVATPDTRRVHLGAVPVVGGLAMGLAFMLAWLAHYAFGGSSEEALVAAAACGVALLGGLLDDRNELRASAKFAFQLLAAALLAFGAGAVLTHLGHLVGADLFTLGRWSLPLTLFAIVGVMNAINMADGMDGLAGGVVLVACSGFGVAAVFAGDALLFTAISLTAGAVLGFLVFNARLPGGRSSAAVYMGDTGSLLLGLLLAWFAIRLSMGERPALAPITAVWIVGLPIADTITLMIRRVCRGRSPFAGDREHLHHILLALGLSHGQVVATLLALSAGFAAIGLAAHYTGVPDYVMFALAMVLTVGHGVAAEVLSRRLGLRIGSSSTTAAAPTATKEARGLDEEPDAQSVP